MTIFQILYGEFLIAASPLQNKGVSIETNLFAGSSIKPHYAWQID